MRMTSITPKRRTFTLRTLFLFQLFFGAWLWANLGWETRRFCVDRVGWNESTSKGFPFIYQEFERTAWAPEGTFSIGKSMV